jgi:hypothetical protein
MKYTKTMEATGDLPRNSLPLTPLHKMIWYLHITGIYSPIYVESALN